MADEEGMEWEGGWNGEISAGKGGYGGLSPDTQIFLPPPDINPLGYSKYPLDRFIEAAYQGDLELLGKMLDLEDPVNGYHADINAHATDMTALQAAAVNGQLEAVEMLLKAKADPHMKTCMPYGRDPKEGETAREMADKFGWEDVAAVLQKAEKETNKGLYMKYGPSNNSKLYPCDRPEGLDPEQERRALAKHKKMVRPVPNKIDRKFYGDLVFGANFGYGSDGKLIKAPTYEYMGDASMMLESGSRTATVGLLFPGEDSVFNGMLSADADLPEVKSMITTAKTILGFDIGKTMAEGPMTSLEKPEVAAPAVFIASLAAHAKMKAKLPEQCERVGSMAGLEIGEYAALVASGVLPFDAGLTLVKAYGEALAEATPQTSISVASLDKDTLEGLCKQVAAKSNSVCQITAELFPKGFLCCAASSVSEELKTLALKAGALQAFLRSSTAIHTPSMKPAQEKIEKLFKEMLPKMSPPSCDLFLNATGAVVPKGTDPKEIYPLVLAQMTSVAKWETCVKSMIAGGVTEFVEVGPMKQLKAMMKRIDQSSWTNMLNYQLD
jgi:[acyl-carrier-protein] S-malonyltransferase